MLWIAVVVLIVAWSLSDLVLDPPPSIGPLAGTGRAPLVEYGDLVGLELHSKAWGHVWNNLQFQQEGFYDLNSHVVPYTGIVIIEESAVIDQRFVSFTPGLFSMTLDMFDQTEAEYIKSQNVTAYARAFMADGGLPLKVGQRGLVFSTLVYRTSLEALFARIVLNLCVLPKAIQRIGTTVNFVYEVEVAKPPDAAERLAKLQEQEANI
mmetsp:Transcript_8674/g.14057  ORF Transcript_8674/g.14057 Transcript_8674/m.14057 type:complete len:208 (+) Transcript_8674:76-699(+)